MHIFNNRLLLVCVQEDENHGMLQRYRRSVFLFHKRTKSAMVKCKLHPGLKQLNYTGNRTSALCKHLHSQDANTKLAKNPEWWCSWVNANPSSAIRAWHGIKSSDVRVRVREQSILHLTYCGDHSEVSLSWTSTLLSFVSFVITCRD